MALRILHFADLHLDRSFGDTGIVSSGIGTSRRNALREVLRRIVDMAKDLAVDYLTVGGDLYEHERATTDTGSFLRGQFERVSPIKVIIAPGNHDPFTVDSLYRQVAWPPNVTVITSPEVTLIETVSRVNMYGAAHVSPSNRANLVRGMELHTPPPNILLLHASDETSVPEGKACYCPLSPIDLVEAGFNLALLGHYHGLRLPDRRRPVLVYPGSPEPLGFDEVGPHYALLIEIDGETFDIEERQSNVTDYRTGTLDVSGAESRADIEEQIRRWAASQGAGNSYVRLSLTGDISREVDLNTEALVDSCASHFGFLLIRDQTYPRVEIDPDEPTVRGRFVRRMQGQMDRAANSEERQQLENALLYGLDALEKREIHPR